ncbi:restriction endonuclease [Deinococcus roseus]|uniref:Restriction endonuclease n=1 Tax=Deinococcus roseus TaxID=392414 RepID=A0ABQ2D2E4_9DEIO|nr:restriction endonuclease [Deinococcus roseus]GGJ43174.1 restriction endonuclease [Deinococcus roseus]
MTLWLVRAGSQGERESFALEQGLAVIGWNELPDLGRFDSKEALKDMMDRVYFEQKPKTIINWLGQVWAFKALIQVGDLVALPLKTSSSIAIGRIASSYEYRTDLPEDMRHTRKVDWLKEIPRSAFDQSLLYSLGAFMTVCRIQRDNAEQKVLNLLQASDQALVQQGQHSFPENLSVVPTDADPADSVTDLEVVAYDQIKKRLDQVYHSKGHEFARLIDALLQAQGYVTLFSKPGADGGIDLLAGRGPLGFDPPRLCVQVKATSDKVKVQEVRELEGVMQRVGADQGLFVSWGGYTSSVGTENRSQFFRVRLWNANDVIQHLLQVYERLPLAFRDILPLKRLWVLVPEAAEG